MNLFFTFNAYLHKIFILTLLPNFLQSLVQVEVEYVPEKAELDGEFDEEFRKVFEKFTFTDVTGFEVNRTLFTCMEFLLLVSCMRLSIEICSVIIIFC